MNKEDFNKLTIGTKIWVKGKEETIDHLIGSPDILGFVNIMCTYTWKNICANCSLEAPVKKQKYYLWLFKNGNDIWSPSARLYNDKFQDTSGLCLVHLRDTKDKIKIESIFIEV